MVHEWRFHQAGQLRLGPLAAGVAIKVGTFAPAKVPRIRLANALRPAFKENRVKGQGKLDL
jgi:hypothetical protein